MKKLFPFITVLLILYGCPSPKPIQKEEIPEPRITKELLPEMQIRYATIDLSQYKKKIEKNDLNKFTDQLNKDSIDILTIQGITRYPALKSRLDIVEELSNEAGMKNAFGETINLSGRQNGNGIFTIYPIKSSENLQFENLKSTGFESAIQAFVDCGVKEVVIVSTQISEKATAGDIKNIHTSLRKLFQEYSTKPIIISGNINATEDTLINVIPNEDHKSPTVWFTKNNSLKLINEQTVQTIFGKMKIINFGIFREIQR